MGPQMNVDQTNMKLGPVRLAHTFSITMPRINTLSHSFSLALIGGLAFLLSSCAVGPTYVKPEVPTPASFKEGGNEWRLAQPKDDAPKGPWWEVFGDPVLSGLLEQVEASNPSLAA